jgi:hypothetical protein
MTVIGTPVTTYPREHASCYFGGNAIFLSAGVSNLFSPFGLTYGEKPAG